jgi:hypothetical protein
MSPFAHPWLLIAAILAVAALYVVFPVARHAYRRRREPQLLTCPETQEPAAVFVDARRAALTAALGKERLRVANCSLWPARRGCAQSCLKHL